MKNHLEDIISATLRAQQLHQSRRQRLTEQRQAIGRARGLPLPKADLIARAKAEIATTGAWALAKTAGPDLLGYLGNPIEVGHLPWQWDQPLPWGVLCAAAPDQALDLMVRFINALEYEAGAPWAQRAEQIASLERALAEAEAEDELETDREIEAGLNVQHRQDVQARRFREAKQAAHDAAVAEVVAHTPRVEHVRHAGYRPDDWVGRQ